MPTTKIILPVSREQHLLRVFASLEVLECDRERTGLHIVRRVPALSLPEDSARYCRRRRLPWADSLRHAEAEIAVFAGFPEVDRSTSQPESQRQSRRTSPTKINKEVISKQVRNGRSEV